MPSSVSAISYVNRFMEGPTVEHQGAVKRILRYIADALHFGLHFTKAPSNASFVGYIDSDLAGNVNTSKSTSGALFFLSNCLVN